MELLVNIASDAYVFPDLLSSNGLGMDIRSKIFRLCIRMPLLGACVEEKVQNRIDVQLLRSSNDTTSCVDEPQYSKNVRSLNVK